VLGKNRGPRSIAALVSAAVACVLLAALWAGVASASRNLTAPGQIEICKAPDNGAAGSQFSFTVSNSKGSQTVPVTGGTCSSAMDETPGSYSITEDLSSGLWTVASVAVQPAAAWLSETDKRGLVKVTVTSGAETQVTFTDTGAAATMKVCKWTSSPTLVGNQYSFTIGSTTVTAVAGKSLAAANCSAAVSTQPGTRLTITENTPAGQQVVRADPGGSATITSQKGSVIKATAGAGANIVYVENEPIGPPQTGFVEICKDAYDQFVSGMFHFDLATTSGVNLDGNGEDILVGQCSGPIQVPIGNVVITEAPTANTQVQSIWAVDPATLGITNLVNGTATAVVPVSADPSNEVQVHFVNKTPTSTLKICKYLPAGSEALAGQTFNFTVSDDAFGTTTYPISIVASAGPNGACKIVTVTDRYHNVTPVQFPLGSTATAVETNNDQFVNADGNGPATDDSQSTVIGSGTTNTIPFTNVALGQLEICKNMIVNRYSVSALALGQPESSLGQTFTFNYVNKANSKIKGTVKVAAGACSLPQVVPAGTYQVSEDLSKLTVMINGQAVPAFQAVASDARGPFGDNRCVPQQSTPPNTDLPVVGTTINTNCGVPTMTAVVPYFNANDPVNFGETQVTFWNKLVRASVKICKQVTSDSMASLGNQTFTFSWSASTDGGDTGVTLKPGTCTGNLGNFPIAGTGLTSAVVTVTETAGPGSHVDQVTLTGGAPVIVAPATKSGFGGPGLNGTIPYKVTFNPGPGTNVVTYYDQANPAAG